MEVGDAPVQHIRMASRDKRCAKCGEVMIEDIVVAKRGQMRYEASKGRFHTGRVFCPRGCAAGWKTRR